MTICNDHFKITVVTMCRGICDLCEWKSGPILLRSHIMCAIRHTQWHCSQISGRFECAKFAYSVIEKIEKFARRILFQRAWSKSCIVLTYPDILRFPSKINRIYDSFVYLTNDTVLFVCRDIEITAETNLGWMCKNDWLSRRDIPVLKNWYM